MISGPVVTLVIACFNRKLMQKIYELKRLVLGDLAAPYSMTLKNGGKKCIYKHLR